MYKIIFKDVCIICICEKSYVRVNSCEILFSCVYIFKIHLFLLIRKDTNLGCKKEM